MKLERLIRNLDEEWRTVDEFDAYLARLLGVPKSDTLTGPTQRFGLRMLGVLEEGDGRVRKRPGFVVPPEGDFASIENARLAEAQKREAEEHAARDRDRAAQMDPVWRAQREVMRGVIDERLRELGLIPAGNETTPAVSAGEAR